MIPFPALLGLLPPSALTLSSAPLLSGDAALPGGIRETVLGHLRQIKADLAGEPLVAEQIYRILNATMEA
jgi:hypothetical protein